jgi:two-component system chemotaxis sensor kinase CheA
MAGLIESNRNAFKEEAYELLSELEASLLELEEKPDDRELIGRVFRAMHTIKGSGAMFGFDSISRFTHEVETVYDLVRNEKMSVTRELVNLTLAARDIIRSMLDASDENDATDIKRADDIVAAFRRLVSCEEVSQPTCLKAETQAKCTGTPGYQPSSPVTYRIRFRPPFDIFHRGIDPLFLLDELKGLGKCRIVAQTSSVPSINEFDPEGCYTYWDAILTTDRGINAIKDIFIFVEDGALDIVVIDKEGELDDEDSYKKLGEILVEQGDISFDELRKTLSEQKKLGELLIEKGLIASDKIEAALLEQQHMREQKELRQKAEAASSIRVASEKLDGLVDLVGELVTVQARLSQYASLRKDSELLLISEVVERLTADLRDSTMNIRMLPIGTTFSKFKRLVRDLSQELGKQIELTTDGAETGLDKTVIEKLNDPMVHLIRNSIDHGIETPEERSEKGKPPVGRIHLSASHSGASVLIQIQDDGAGLDREAIRAKAVEKGLIGPESDLSEKEIFAMILAPGFSTAQKVTNVSGRGVGMDVVKRSIDALRGQIEISSMNGEGTTVTLMLPLTLAIIEGLLVRIGKDHFVLPLSVVKECMELTEEDAAEAHGRHIANVRGRIIPYIKLRERFGINGYVPDIEQIVIVEIGDDNIGFVVDAVIGEHQTVIKSLGTFYKHVEGVSGATILGDGTVALILDVSKIAMLAEEKEKTCFSI